MKKVILSLAILMITQASFAYFEEYTTSDNKTLQGRGYSQTLLRIVDDARMLTQGAEKDYVPFYSRKLYPDNPLGKWYVMAKRYFDPAYESGILGVREVEFSNAWFPDSPSYSEKYQPNDKFNRLYDEDIKRLEVAGKTIKGSRGIEPAVEDNVYEPEDSEVESL